MSGFVNKAIIVGHLGLDPEVRTTSSGTKLVRLSIATNDRWKDHDQNTVERTEWHKIVVFGPKAEIAERYLSKGSLIAIEGALRSNKWTDKDGNERESIEIHITQYDGNFTMLGTKSQGGIGINKNEKIDRGNLTPQSEDQKIPNIEDPPF
jgi:single-strand DNA-binding protein